MATNSYDAPARDWLVGIDLVSCQPCCYMRNTWSDGPGLNFGPALRSRRRGCASDSCRPHCLMRTPTRSPAARFGSSRRPTHLELNARHSLRKIQPSRARCTPSSHPRPSRPSSARAAAMPQQAHRLDRNPIHVRISRTGRNPSISRQHPEGSRGWRPNRGSRSSRFGRPQPATSAHAARTQRADL
jgi:hypothetical protein